MHFHIVICGYGFGVIIGGYDMNMGNWTILSWSIIKRDIVWRGERHSRFASGGYNYRCVKNGKEVENISFCSPIVNNLR